MGWKDRAISWAAAQPPVVCKCGCNELVMITWQNFYREIAEYKRGHSPNCGNEPGEFRNTEEDFWSLVDKNKGDCWIWKKCRKDGYGIFFFQGKKRLVHRLSVFFTTGAWPSRFLCHKCDNPSCVNPAHLFEGTQKDNMSDASKKGRINRKFSPDDVLKAVGLVCQGKNLKEAAKEVGMSHSLVQKIVAGELWNHVTGIPETRRLSRGK